MSALSRAQYNQLKTAYRGNYASNADAINISELFNLVKTYDKSFNPKPPSFVVDDSRKPKKVYHSTSERFDAFDYYQAETGVDGIPIIITFEIIKSPQKNKFWVHKVDIKENAEANASGANALKRRPNLDVNNRISNNFSNVNTSNEKNSRDLSTGEVIRGDDEIKVSKDELRTQMGDTALKRWGADITLICKSADALILFNLECVTFGFATATCFTR